MVRVDLSETKFHTGLYTENCFVLAEGWYDDNVFHVLALGFPPAETSDTTRSRLCSFVLLMSSCTSYSHVLTFMMVVQWISRSS